MTKTAQDIAEPTRIAVVEDDSEIRELVVGYLNRDGFEARGYANGAAFDEESQSFDPDVVVLDLMMPGEDGLSICRRIAPAKPVIIISAKSDDVDRIIGLEVGADDYLPKPFNPRELVARIRAILRARAQGSMSATAQVGATESSITASTEREVLRFENWTLDVDGRRLTSPSHTAVSLSTGEFALLTEFARHPQRVLSREQLLDWTRGDTSEMFDRAIDVQLSRLRRKMAEEGGGDLIKTVRGTGYLFSAEVKRLRSHDG